MATSVFITGLSGSTASVQEILGATAVNRGFRVPALKVDGVAVGTRDDTFGNLGGTPGQKDVAVVPGHIYEVDIDNPETRKRLGKRHGIYGAVRGPFVEVPAAAGQDLTNPANVTSVLTTFVVRSLLTESSGDVSQSFISRGTPIQNQDILFAGTDTEEDILAGAITLDLTKPSERRALRLHSGAWCPARAADGLVTIRGLMTTKSAPSASGGYGLSSSRGFRIAHFEDFTDGGENSNLGYVNSTVNLQVNLTDPNVRRALRRNNGRWIVVTAP